MGGSVVEKVYSMVILDVVNAAADILREEGLDEAIAAQLRQLWEEKLKRSVRYLDDRSSSLASLNTEPPQATITNVQSRSSARKSETVTVEINVPEVSDMASVHEEDSTICQQRKIRVEVPVILMPNGSGDELQNILSSPTAQALMSLSPEVAGNLLQQLIDSTASNKRIAESGKAALREVAPQLDGEWDLVVDVSERNEGPVVVEPEATLPKHPKSFELTFPRRTKQETSSGRCMLRVSHQLDGVEDSEDTSSSEDDEESAEDDLENEDSEDEPKQSDGKSEASPLNSEDDVSDADNDVNTNLYETENIVLCQYDRIHHARNRWKFSLKDGMMTVLGRDFIFQKALGEAEW